MEQVADMNQAHRNIRHWRRLAATAERGGESLILLRAPSRTLARSADTPMSDVCGMTTSVWPPFNQPQAQKKPMNQLSPDISY